MEGHETGACNGHQAYLRLGLGPRNQGGAWPAGSEGDLSQGAIDKESAEMPGLKGTLAADLGSPTH